MMVRSLIWGMVVMLLAAPSQATPLPRYGMFVFSGRAGPRQHKEIAPRMALRRFHSYTPE